MKEKHNKGASINVYWLFEKADLPPDLKFRRDRSKKGHYLLTVTRKMALFELVAKLKWVADRMSIMRDAGRAL